MITAVTDTAALFVTAAGLLAAAVALAKTRRLPLAVALLLDFLTAAALLRLAVSPPSWPAIGTAALVIGIRQLASRALAAGRAVRHR
jgi:hypothetical protein